MRILFIGDIFGQPGKTAVHGMLRRITESYSTDVVIANGENIAGGFGITDNLAKKLFRYGVDVITTGNHIWDRPDADDLVSSDMNILRPINFPPGTPGRGSLVFKTANGAKIAVINAQGRVFMRAIDDPLRMSKAEALKLKKITPIVFMDFHAETTSEKKVMGCYLDGIASAVVGTHTHIQTVDSQILPGGTAYITDVGMTGAHDSVIGVRKELATRFVLSGRNVRFAPASGDIRLQGCVIDIDDQTGTATAIERLDLPYEEGNDNELSRSFTN